MTTTPTAPARDDDEHDPEAERRRLAAERADERDAQRLRDLDARAAERIALLGSPANRARAAQGLPPLGFETAIDAPSTRKPLPSAGVVMLRLTAPVPGVGRPGTILDFNLNVQTERFAAGALVDAAQAEVV